MQEIEYSKLCADCGSKQTYSSKWGLDNAIRKNLKCQSCAAPKQMVKQYAKCCEGCGVIQKYRWPYQLKAALLKNTKCKHCANLGELNPNYTGIHSVKGKDHPNYGRIKPHSDETKKKIGDANRGRLRPDMKINNPMNKIENRIKVSERMKNGNNPLRGRKPWNTGMGVDKLSDYKKYEREVWNITNKHITLIPNFDVNKRGRAGEEGAHHVDHIYSIRKGFRNNVDPSVIGALDNLQFITWQENNNRRDLFQGKRK